MVRTASLPINVVLERMPKKNSKIVKYQQYNILLRRKKLKIHWEKLKCLIFVIINAR